MAKIHNLKTWSYWFKKIKSGEKKFEIRFNDRNFKIGEVLHLMNYDPVEKTLSDEGVHKTIKNVYRDVFGLEENYVVLIFEPEENEIIDTVKSLNYSAWHLLEALKKSAYPSLRVGERTALNNIITMLKDIKIVLDKGVS